MRLRSIGIRIGMLPEPLIFLMCCDCPSPPGHTPLAPLSSSERGMPASVPAPKDSGFRRNGGDFVKILF